MNKTTRIRQWVGATVLTVALVLLGVSILSNQSHVDTESAARDLGEAVTRRLDRLDGFIAEAFAQDPEAWMQLRDSAPLRQAAAKRQRQAALSYRNGRRMQGKA